MGFAVSRRGLLVGSAVLVLCAGGVVAAATVGASPAPGPEIGPPVVVGGTTPAGSGNGNVPPSSLRSASNDADGQSSTGSEQHEDHHEEPDVVGPAPVREVDDDPDESGKSSGG